MKLSEQARLEQEVIDLRKALLNSQRSEGRAKAKTSDLIDAVHEAARLSLLATPRTKLQPPLKDIRKGKAEVALVHLTDWQAGKQTVSYDIGTLSARIEQMIDKVVQLTVIQRAHHPVKDCVVMLGGDMLGRTCLNRCLKWYASSSKPSVPLLSTLRT
jgi:hypothetical protein